jgi:hypothetical protein
MMTEDHHDFFKALAPLLEAIGGDPIDPNELESGDIRLEWQGEVVGGVRLPPLSHALEILVSRVETEMGARLGDLDRVGKQVAVRRLDEQGAFLLRKSIEYVADVMGVSRITIYNYLNAIRE